jgi:hypothetical protein
LQREHLVNGGFQINGSRVYFVTAETARKNTK